MKRKNIIIGIVLLSMLFLAACGEEKPLADRVIENLEDCMDAREVTEEEYAELKRVTHMNPLDIIQSKRTENAYIRFKEEDIGVVSTAWSRYADSEISVKNAIIYDYDSKVDEATSYVTVAIYDFSCKEDMEAYIAELRGVLQDWYLVVKKGIPENFYAKDRLLGEMEGENYIYMVVEHSAGEAAIEEDYVLWSDTKVLTVFYTGYEDNELYPKFKKFLKKMKFEGLNDIKLEYAEPQSGDE